MSRTAASQDGLDIDTLARNADSWLKLVGSGIALLYVFGLIVSNFSQGMFDYSDYGLFRAQYITVGIAFVVFATLPLILLNFPLLIDLVAPNWLARRSLAPFLRAGAFLFAFLVIPYLFSFAIPYVSRSEYYFGNLNFWTLYLYPTAIYPLVLLWLPFTLWAYLSVFKKLLRWKSWLLRIVPAGIVLLLHPYANWVFPNIHASAGGGQPQVGHIILRSPLTDVPDLELPLRLADLGTTIPAIVWYRSANMYYFSLAASAARYDRVTIFAVKADEVRAVVITPQYVRIKGYFLGPLELAQEIIVESSRAVSQPD
jgi:hypothetical protein